MLPVSVFLSRFKSVSAMSLPSSDTKGPDNWFSARFRYHNFLRLPSSVGTLPPRRLNPKSMWVRLFMFPILGDKIPVRPKLGSISS